MTSEQFVALLAALTALIGALSAAIVAFRGLTHAVDGRLQELLEERTAAARREGELAGRDFMRRLMSGESADPPTPLAKPD